MTDILQDLKQLNNLNPNSKAYKDTYNKVINVGEFKLKNNTNEIGELFFPTPYLRNYKK
jgi:hypothetical protein